MPENDRLRGCLDEINLELWSGLCWLDGNAAIPGERETRYGAQETDKDSVPSSTFCWLVHARKKSIHGRYSPDAALRGIRESPNRWISTSRAGVPSHKIASPNDDDHWPGRQTRELRAAKPAALSGRSEPFFSICYRQTATAPHTRFDRLPTVKGADPQTA